MTDPPKSKLSTDYLEALRWYDADGLETRLEVARHLGATAVEQGFGILELAKIHDGALTDILSVSQSTADRNVTTTRATIFFNEALTPIEKTHRGAQDAALALREIHIEFDQRTKELAVSLREVKREAGERRSAEDALRTSEETASELLAESRVLEEELREMTHRNLSANEAERKQISLQLRDEVAQTLLGIHVRLLVLNKEASACQESLTEQIAITQRLVARSVKAIGSLAGTLSTIHEC